MSSESIHLGTLETQCTVDYLPSPRPDSASSRFNPFAWFTTETAEPDRYHVVRPDGTVTNTITVPYPLDANYPETTVRTFVERNDWDSLTAEALLLAYGEYGLAEQYPSVTESGHPFVCVLKTGLWKDRNHGSYVGLYEVDERLTPFVIVRDELRALPESDVRSCLTSPIGDDKSITGAIRTLLQRRAIPIQTRLEQGSSTGTEVHSAQVSDSYAAKIPYTEYYFLNGQPMSY